MTIDLHAFYIWAIKLSVVAQKPYIPLHYVGQIQQFLEGIGIKTESWLAKAHLSPQDVLEDRKLVTLQVYQALILDAQRLSNYPHLGLLIGHTLSINSHGSLGFALLSCQNIEQVLAIFQRFVSTRTPLVTVNVITRAKHLCIELQDTCNLGPIKPCFHEVMCITIINILRTVLPSNSVVLAVAFPFVKPNYHDLYQQYIDCDVTFNSDIMRLTLDSSRLQDVLVYADQYALMQAKTLCERELQKVKYNQGMKGHVFNLLMNSREQFLTLVQISHSLNMSSRTLHRHLEKSNTSYQQILDEVKSVLALQYLQNHKQSVKQAAYNLGYSDVANFRRAFKRWHGKNPSQMKEQ